MTASQWTLRGGMGVVIRRAYSIDVDDLPDKDFGHPSVTHVSHVVSGWVLGAVCVRLSV